MDLTTIIGYLFSMVTGFAGWWVGRAKQKNDFLGDLQKSINMLTDENTKLLTELLELKKQNFELMANQERMKIQIDRLTQDNKGLREQVTKLNGLITKTKK